MALPDEFALDLGRVAADCIAVRVRLIHRVISAIYDDALRPHGLRISQGNILVVVAQQGQIRPADLCRWLRIEKSTLSRDIEVMKRHGWIESDPPDGGRNQILCVTTAGLAMLAAITPAWEQAQAEARQCLGADGVDHLHAIADRLGLGQP